MTRQDPSPALACPPGADMTTILGVDYAHFEIPDHGDLYVTRHGLPFAENLKPENWYEHTWFVKRRERLEGTSTIYRLPTKPVGGHSIDLVVKWCRVGADVPVDTLTFDKFARVEFNSPYEEFSLLMEMRDSPHGVVRTHRPLAIYVPLKRVELWQTGRREYMIARKKAKYRDVELDIYRQYILIYEWIEGVSAFQAVQQLGTPLEARTSLLERLTGEATGLLAGQGFTVIDMKPQHLIVRPQPDGSMLRRHGKVVYALVDFELLQRTPEHEKEVIGSRRAAYLVRQRDRFVAPAGRADYPPNLQPAQVLGVDFVHGHSESTHGMLWIVGKDPGLFDYFQPERWRRTKRTKISEDNEVYYTRTKDNINLVWKVSRVGELPDVPDTSPTAHAAIAHGYNSPFEEFAIALELSKGGFPTVYPRAVYMTGLEALDYVYAVDHSRFMSHEPILAPDGLPALRHDHNYITVWGFWNGLDELLATRDSMYCTGVNVRQALDQGLITREEHDQLLARVAAALSKRGFENLNPKGSHYLLSIGPDGALVRESDGQLAVRMCNFGLVRRVSSP